MGERIPHSYPGANAPGKERVLWRTSKLSLLITVSNKVVTIRLVSCQPTDRSNWNRFMPEVPGSISGQREIECSLYYSLSSPFLGDVVNTSFELGCFREIIKSVIKPETVRIVIDELADMHLELALVVARFLCQASAYQVRLWQRKRLAAAKMAELKSKVVSAGFDIESLDLSRPDRRVGHRKSKASK